jgi:dipeptidyl aminopeptidase/acylaminoacyl peptidase
MRSLLAILGASGLMALAVALSVGRNGPENQESGPTLPLALGMIHPRLAPDGQTIAASYLGAIWVMPAGGGLLSRLTGGEGFDHEPAWSPDGKSLAFVRGPNQPGGEMHLIAVASGKETALPRPVYVRGTYNFHKLQFHPAGGRILGVFRAGGKDHGLAWYDLASGAVTSLAVELSAWARYALSPDGRWIVYSATADKPNEQTGNDGIHADLWRIPASGGKAEKIVRFPCRVHDLCWTADGTGVIVVSELGGAYYDLWRVPLADSLRNMTRLTAGQADEDRPSVSRDGKRLLYTDNRHGATMLMMHDIATGREQAVAVDRLDYRCPTGRLRLLTRDGKTRKPIATRISLTQESGKFAAPPGALYRVLRTTPHFYCDQSAEWTLPAGKYRLRAYRGPEYEPAIQEVTIVADGTRELTVDLSRWTHAAASGWYSGENHIHANYGYGQWHNTPATMLAQCSGEDLNVCNLMVANSDTDGTFDRAYFRGRPDALSTVETILYWNQEFRSTLWGHMTLVNLKQVVEPVFTGFLETTNPWDIPTNADIADRTHWQKGHVNYTHPVQNAAKPLETPYSAKALPVDVALGKIDSLDLNNSYTATVPVWYRLLNCGFRLPPSAGTDCFLNRIFSQLPGGDRVYVHIPGGLSYAGWIDGLRKGRSFVTNGPMLELTVDGQELGDIVRLAGPRSVKVKAKAWSHFPLAKVELIVDGQVAATIPLAKDDRSAALDKEVMVPRSGWLVLRASGPGHPDSPQPALFAHSAPIYLEVGGIPVRSREDAEFFLAWIDELALRARTRDRVPDAEQRQHVQEQMEKARLIYGRIAREGK